MTAVSETTTATAATARCHCRHAPTCERQWSSLCAGHCSSPPPAPPTSTHPCPSSCARSRRWSSPLPPPRVAVPADLTRGDLSSVAPVARTHKTRIPRVADGPRAGRGSPRAGSAVPLRASVRGAPATASSTRGWTASGGVRCGGGEGSHQRTWRGAAACRGAGGHARNDRVFPAGDADGHRVLALAHSPSNKPQEKQETKTTAKTKTLPPAAAPPRL